MSIEERPELNNPEEVDSPSRREFIKMAGISAMGLAYTHPIVETLCGPHDPPQDYDPTTGSSDSDSDSHGGCGRGKKKKCPRP